MGPYNANLVTNWVAKFQNCLYDNSKYKYPDSPLTDSYFRYFGLYYPKKDLVGSPATSDIFEHCVNSYI